jgi:hypothetical protein
MEKRLFVLVAVVLVAGTAPAVTVNIEDFQADLEAIASQLAFDPSLPAAGLGAYWPAEVDELANLPPIVATINDPAALNVALGEGAEYHQGDFVVLRARDDGFGARFFTRGQGWDHPLETDALSVQDFRIACAGMGIGIKVWGDPHVSLRDGGRWFTGIVEDPAAFAEAFGGEGEVTKVQSVILRAGAKHTLAYAAPPWETDHVSITALGCVDGEVRVRALK